jgi:hypothetical protein
MIKQAQSVEQDEHLSAAGHAVEDVELETGFQLLAGQICEGGEENQWWIGAYSLLCFI